MSADADLERFARQLSRVAAAIGDAPLDEALEACLNREIPARGELFQEIFAMCCAAVQAGWMCQRSAGGIRYGRVIKPQQQLGRFSVDVVEMGEVAGPSHAHPNGEIDMIMPLDPVAEFDGRRAGWLVYPPGSTHAPTVTRGKALILYLLPEGVIDFKQTAIT